MKYLRLHQVLSKSERREICINRDFIRWLEPLKDDMGYRTKLIVVGVNDPIEVVESHAQIEALATGDVQKIKAVR